MADRDTDLLFANPDQLDEFGLDPDEELEEADEGEDDAYLSDGYEEAPPPSRGRPVPSMAGVRETLEERRAERMRLLMELEKYREQDATRALVPDDLGIDTPLERLRDVYGLCEHRLKTRTASLNRQHIVRMMRKGPVLASMALEAMNNGVLAPEDQFALHGFAQSMSMVTEAGEFDEIHAQIAERYIQTRLGQALTNPLLMWVWMFGQIAVDHVQDRKEAYRTHQLPDPRVERARQLTNQARRAKEAEPDTPVRGAVQPAPPGSLIGQHQHQAPPPAVAAPPRPPTQPIVQYEAAWGPELEETTEATEVTEATEAGSEAESDESGGFAWD